MLVRLAELLPAGIKVCIVADRGFGDQKLYKMLTEELYFDYVIRFRGNIAVTDACGETRSAAAWVRAGGRARVLHGAAVTADRYPVATVVCVRDRCRLRDPVADLSGAADLPPRWARAAGG